MSWTTVIWSMAAGVSLTLAAVYLLVWYREQDAFEHLFFGASAVAAAVLAMQELTAMHAQTPAEYGATLRWAHVSAATITISLVWFVRHYLGTGRLWLAWLITGLRLLILVVNFSLFENATFQEIHALREVVFLGESLSVPVGEENPWRFLIHLSMVLLLFYVLDASNTARKQGRSKQALVLGATIPIALVLSAIFSSLMVRGVLPGPLVALVYQLVVLAMAYELSADLIRASRLSRELRANEERMRLASRAADMGLWEWDIARDEVWTNEVDKERTGISDSGHLSLERYLSLVNPVDRERVRQALHGVLEHDDGFEVEFRMKGLDGDERWIAASGQLERGAQRQPLLLRGTSMDITARKHSEAELQKYRSELGRAQRVSALGQLSAALAHELSQPLGAILRNAEAGELFLRNDPPDLRELREILIDIQRDDRRAADVIDRMRALLRDRQLRFEAIPVTELVEQVATLLSPEMQARHVAMRAMVPPDLPKVRGDRVHLQQVLINLLLNSLEALDAAQNGVRHIEIGAVEVEDGLIEMSVKDTGPGIDREKLPHLFEPFVTTKDGGTGIGLAITRTIVEAHRGCIWAENHPDGGALIRMTLPIAQEEATA